MTEIIVYTTSACPKCRNGAADDASTPRRSTELARKSEIFKTCF